MTQSSNPVGYRPTLMLKDDEARVIAIPIAKSDSDLISKAKGGGRGAYSFIVDVLRKVNYIVEGAYVYGVEGTSISDLLFLSKLGLRKSGAQKEVFVKGDTSEVLALVLTGEGHIYVSKKIMDSSSSKLR